MLNLVLAQLLKAKALPFFLSESVFLFLDVEFEGVRLQSAFAGGRGWVRKRGHLGHGDRDASMRGLDRL